MIPPAALGDDRPEGAAEHSPVDGGVFWPVAVVVLAAASILSRGQRIQPG